MLRALVLLSVIAATATEASAQGISFVTRRTSTLERQQRARAFFDAAGATVTAPPVTMPEPPPTTVATTPPGAPPVAAGQSSTAKGRPAVAAVRIEGAPARTATTVLPPVSQRAKPFAVRAGTRAAAPVATTSAPTKSIPAASPPSR